VATPRRNTVWSDTVAPTTAANRITDARFRDGDVWNVDATGEVYVLTDDTVGTWIPLPVLEGRTSDPVSPVSGQMWLREDLLLLFVVASTVASWVS
jgi:hypothetical protein